MPVADGDYRKRLGDKRRGLAKAKRERAFSSAPTGPITKGSSIKGLLSGLVVDAAEPLTKTLLNAFGGAVHGLSSAQGTSSLTGGTTDPRVGQYLGDTSTLGQRLTRTALEYAPVSEKVKADRRELWNAPATGSTVALAASDFMPDPLPPGAGAAVGSLIGKRALPGLADAPILRDIFETAAQKLTPKDKPANAAKLEALGERGILSEASIKPFVDASMHTPDPNIMRNILEKVDIGGRPLGDVKVLPPSSKFTKDVTYSTTEPTIQRVDVGRPTKDGVRNMRVGLFTPDGEAISLLGATAGGRPIPGYTGNSFISGITLPKLIKNPGVLDQVTENYAAAARSVAANYPAGSMPALSDDFYQTTTRLSDEMAKAYEGAVLPGGRPVTQDLANDLGAFLSSGTDPLLQIPQTEKLIQVALSDKRVADGITKAMTALNKGQGNGFATKKEAQDFLVSWRKQYFNTKTPHVQAVVDAFKEAKLGTSRSAANVSRALSGGADIAVNDEGKYIIAGGFGIPRFTWMTPDTVAKTGVYGIVESDAYTKKVVGDTAAVVNDVWDAGASGQLEYEPLTGKDYTAYVNAAAKGYLKASPEMAERWRKMGHSQKEIKRRVEGPSNFQAPIWGFGRGEVAPLVINPVVKRFKW